MDYSITLMLRKILNMALDAGAPENELFFKAGSNFMGAAGIKGSNPFVEVDGKKYKVKWSTRKHYLAIEW